MRLISIRGAGSHIREYPVEFKHWDRIIYDLDRQFSYHYSLRPMRR